MKARFLRYCHYAFYSFPFQLFLLHIKKHAFFILCWLILFGAVSQFFGVSYGIPLLFLDPEYLGEVNFLSFLIVGFTMGGFFMAWNISFYILNSFRFEFLASLVNPFIQFCLNNIFFPLLFTIVYIVSLVKFQHVEALIPTGKIIGNVFALLLGNLLMVIFTTLFFILFDHNVEKFIGNLSNKAKESLLGKKINLKKLTTNREHNKKWNIETYWKFPFTIGFVRKVDFYDKKLINQVLFHHHRNAFIVQIFSIEVLIAFGKLMENPYFRLPAASSIFLVFSVIIVLFSFVTFWFRSWRTIALVLFIVLLNFLTQFNLVVYKNKIYGLDYTSKKIEYNNDVVNNAATGQMVNADIVETSAILDNWKKRMNAKYGEEKPKLIFINTSGGGLKATYWTFHVLQELEKQTNKKLFDHTFLLTGASGGMIGSAFFRELYLRQKNHEAVDYLHKSYLDDIGQDMLNGTGTSIATNDIFYPWQSYEYEGLKYKKDRAYMFNMQMNENTHFMMNKKLLEYKKDEQQANIPMMIVGATIINDQRFLFFSPQHISYLIKPYIQNGKGYLDNLSTDAVEYMRFFKSKGAENINFIDALRTNATYPYIMPAVYLPTNPEIKAMDAGIRENSGFAVSTRFYSVFQDWINENTSGVIFISIRVDNKLRDFDPKNKETYISELLSPVGSIFNNFILLQDYNSDVSLAYLENASKTDINVLNFNYDQTMKRKKAAMSWHLTNLEKLDIQHAFAQENNVLMLKKLKELLK